MVPQRTISVLSPCGGELELPVLIHVEIHEPPVHHETQELVRPSVQFRVIRIRVRSMCCIHSHLSHPCRPTSVKGARVLIEDRIEGCLGRLRQPYVRPTSNGVFLDQVHTLWGPHGAYRLR